MRAGGHRGARRSSAAAASAAASVDDSSVPSGSADAGVEEGLGRLGRRIGFAGRRDVRLCRPRRHRCRPPWGSGSLAAGRRSGRIPVSGGGVVPPLSSLAAPTARRPRRRGSARSGPGAASCRRPCRPSSPPCPRPSRLPWPCAGGLRGGGGLGGDHGRGLRRVGAGLAGQFGGPVAGRGLDLCRRALGLAVPWRPLLGLHGRLLRTPCGHVAELLGGVGRASPRPSRRAAWRRGQPCWPGSATFAAASLASRPLSAAAASATFVGHVAGLVRDLTALVETLSARSCVRLLIENSSSSCAARIGTRSVPSADWYPAAHRHCAGPFLDQCSTSESWPSAGCASRSAAGPPRVTSGPLQGRVETPVDAGAEVVRRRYRQGAGRSAPRAPRAGRPCASARCRRPSGNTSATGTGRPSSADSDVTPASRMPHGTIRSNAVEIGVAVQGEPVHRHPFGDPDADGGDLALGPPVARRQPDAAASGNPAGVRQPELVHRCAIRACSRIRTQVDHVDRIGERDDRVADQLAGTVPGDPAAAVDVDDRGAVDREIARLGPAAGGVDVGVLEQQNGVATGAVDPGRGRSPAAAPRRSGTRRCRPRRRPAG